MRLNHPLALALATLALSVPSFAFDYEVQRLGGALSHIGALAVIGISVAASLVHVVDGIKAHVRWWSWVVTIGMAAYMFLVIFQTVLRAEFQTQAGNESSDSAIAIATSAIKTRETLRQTWQTACDQIAAPRREIRAAAATACTNINLSLEEDRQDREILAAAQRARVKTGADIAGDAYIYFTAFWRAVIFPVGNVACLYFAAVLLRRHEAEREANSASAAPAPAPQIIPQATQKAPQNVAERDQNAEEHEDIPPEIPAEHTPADGSFWAWLDGLLGLRTTALPPKAPDLASEKPKNAPEQWRGTLAGAERGEIVLVADDRIGISGGGGRLEFVHFDAPAPEIPAEATKAEQRRIEKEHAESVHVGELPKLPAPPKAKRTREEFAEHCRVLVASGVKPTFANLYDTLPGGKGDKTTHFRWWKEMRDALYADYNAAKQGGQACAEQ